MANSIIALNKSMGENSAPSGKIVFGKIYANWCGHCKTLEPHWESLKGKMEGFQNVAFEEIESTNQDAELGRINNTYLNGSSNKVALQGGYPTIFCIKKNNVEYYNGQRDTDNMYKWCIMKTGNSIVTKSVTARKPPIRIGENILLKKTRKTKRNRRRNSRKNRYMKRANMKQSIRRKLLK